ncbi:transposable element Tcb2 transposase [Trichonephila clavipes]|nr:transposable element Tcb2 transposase [Trichonephila clavipes]
MTWCQTDVECLVLKENAILLACAPRVHFLKQQNADHERDAKSHSFSIETWRVVGRLEGGQTQAEVAQAIGVSQSVISRIWNRFLETGSAGRRPGQGRRRATTPNEDRYLVLTARRHRNMNATFSNNTLALLLAPRFQLRLSETGSMVDEILRPIVVPYAAAIGDDFILMDDNCRPRRANLVEGFPFRGRNRMNGMTSVFSRYESNRARLGRSRKTSCWPPTTPTNSPRNGKSSSGRVGQNIPTRD